MGWRWPHLCLGAWAHIRGAVQADMRKAFRASGVEASVRSQLRPHDVAVHMRCFPFFTDTYPLAGFSFYKTLPEQWRYAPNLRLFLVAGTLGPVCQVVADSLEAFLHREYPQAAVHRRFNITAHPRTMAEDL